MLNKLINLFKSNPKRLKDCKQEFDLGTTLYKARIECFTIPHEDYLKLTTSEQLSISLFYEVRKGLKSYICTVEGGVKTI